MLTKSDVIVYHDETRQTGPNGNLQGHILYFVPICFSKRSERSLFADEVREYNPQNYLIDYISSIVDQHRVSGHKIHFTELSGRKWYQKTEAYLQVVNVGVDSLRKRNPSLLKVPGVCKMAVMLYPSNIDVSLFGGEKKEQTLRNDETIIRMLLKGALHLLYSPEDRVKLIGLVSDGDPHHRSIDDRRIFERMRHDRFSSTTSLRE